MPGVALVTKVWFVLNPLFRPRDASECNWKPKSFFEGGETDSCTMTSDLMKRFFIRSPMRFSFKLWGFTPNAQILKLISHFSKSHVVNRKCSNEIRHTVSTSGPRSHEI